MIAKPLALIATTVVAIAVSTATSESPVREVMNFDFAWRFRNFDVATSDFPGCSGTFTKMVDTNCGQNQRGSVLESSALTADECMAQCCLSPMCRLWLFSADDGGCYLDRERELHCNVTAKGWVGGYREAPAPMQPMPASWLDKAKPDFDDSSWTGVDAPHDSLIGGNYSQNASRGHGYLPYKVGVLSDSNEPTMHWHASPNQNSSRFLRIHAKENATCPPLCWYLGAIYTSTPTLA